MTGMSEQEQAIAMSGTVALLSLLSLPARKMLRVRHRLIKHQQNRFHRRPHARTKTGR